MAFQADMPAHLKAEIAASVLGVILVGAYVIGVNTGLAGSLNYLCILMPAILLAVGLLGFVRDGVTIVPKGAGAMGFRKIYVYNPFIPLFLAFGALLAYYVIVSIATATLLLLGYPVAVVVLVVLTGLYIFGVAMVLGRLSGLTVVEINGDEITIKTSSKTHRAPLSEVKIATTDMLREYGIVPMEKRLYLRSRDWVVEIKNFRDDKAFQKFHSYMYYRLNPDRYEEAKKHKSAR